MSHTGIDAATVWIEPTDHDIIRTHQCGQHAHGRDQPERRISGNGERKPNHIGLAGAPVAVKNRRRAFPVDIAWPLNVGWNQFLLRNETGSRDERSHCSKHGFGPQLLLFNDADEVSCRAGAIKCSRCRASFAPIRTAFAERNLVPPLDQPLADPLSETKNWRNLLTGKCDSQVSHSLPAHLEPFIGDEAIPNSRLGLNETWICRIAFNLLAQVGDINAEILAVLSTSARRTTGNRSPRGSVVCGGRPA